MTNGVVWLIRMLLVLLVLHLTFARESRAGRVLDAPSAEATLEGVLNTPLPQRAGASGEPLLYLPFARESRAKPTDKNGFVFDLNGVPISEVVSLYFKEVAKQPYVICADVLGDDRPVSLRVQGRSLDSVMMSALLGAYGYRSTVESGVVFICKKPEHTVQAEDFSATVVFRPEFRDVGYLVELASPLVRGVFANRRTSAPALAVGGADHGGSLQGSGSKASPEASSGSAYSSSTGDDFLVFSGSEKEAEKLRKLLAQLDVPAGEVLIKGYVYEVGSTQADQAALDVLLSVLKGKVQVDIAGPVLGNALRIKTAALDVVASVIKTDSRFKLVTSPYARVRSGATARFMSGADVPVLGSIVTNATGQTQQSVEYRSAGTILQVAPKVRGKVADVDLFQQVSSFVATESGVNGSPTLNKRELRTSLSIEDGELLVVGGLNDSKTERQQSGLFFLPFSTSRSSAARNTEILVILELQRL